MSLVSLLNNVTSFVLYATLAWHLGNPAHLAADQPTKVGDLFWVWGNPEMTRPGEPTNATFAEASSAGRARLLGAPNIMMAGAGLPDDWQEGVRLTEEVKDFPGIAWEISPDGGGGAPFVYKRRMAQARALYDQYPQIAALILDDMSSVSRSRGFQPVHIRQIRQELTGKYAAMRLWGVVYTMNLYESNMGDYIKELDVILLPEWFGNKVGEFEKHEAYVEKQYPDKPIIFCTYLYDYGGGRRMSQELLEKQFTTALRLAHEGRIAGIEITMVTNDEEAVRWTVEWIRSVADQPIKNPTQKSYLKPAA